MMFFKKICIKKLLKQDNGIINWIFLIYFYAFVCNLII